MASVNLVVIVESVRTIATKEGDDLAAFHLPSIIAVAAALGKPDSSLASHPFSIPSQLSSLFSLSIHFPFVKSPAKFKSSGKTTGMTCGSILSVCYHVLATGASPPTLSQGILMSCGGSKLRWCWYYILRFGSHTHEITRS